MRLFALTLFLTAAATTVDATAPQQVAPSVEATALAVYESACLSTPIAERGTAAWAKSSGAQLVSEAEHNELVLGPQLKVWRSPEPVFPIYVSLGTRLDCSVWFTTREPAKAREAFQRKVEAELAKTHPSLATTTIHRDGEVAPGLFVLSYVTRFSGEPVGLMWSVYVSRAESPAKVWYDAARVR